MDRMRGSRRRGKSHDYCWHLGCILPKSASNNRANQIVANIMKYGATLEGVLADSVVDSDEKEFLARFRAAHGVTEAQHKAALREHGWSIADFHRGHRLEQAKEAPNLYSTEGI